MKIKQIIYITLISLCLTNCQSSDDSIPELQTNNEMPLIGIGVDRLQFNGGFSGGWWEYKAKGDANYTKTDITNSSVTGLKPGTTYQLIYKNKKNSSQVYTYTTKAFEFDYNKITKEQSCFFNERMLHTNREYAFYTEDPIEHTTIDMYLINKTFTDSIKISTKIGTDKKSIHFKIPDTVFYDTNMPELTYLGFKAGDKMDYYFNSMFDFNQYKEKRYVPARRYEDLLNNIAPGIYVENTTPRLHSVKAIRSSDNKYTTILIHGNMYGVYRVGTSNCAKKYEALGTTLVIYLEDQKTIYMETSNNKDVTIPSRTMNTFETFWTPNVPASVRDRSLQQFYAIQYYTNLMPKGKYYFQYKALLANGDYYESNKLEFITNGIMQMK
ncbi:hypothetical protein AS361_01890 [Myroides marinus]|uniref:hypothetical protein n=1 Tax=Myroides marinus TaxID=703342 RepID=UPI0007419AE2|nr:hypothetical protein [Myroides marinus]KUF39356.1 hypothetical protein AS361_01890 [Myroides marinus]